MEYWLRITWFFTKALAWLRARWLHIVLAFVSVLGSFALGRCTSPTKVVVDTALAEQARRELEAANELHRRSQEALEEKAAKIAELEREHTEEIHKIKERHLQLAEELRKDPKKLNTFLHELSVGMKK